MGNKFSMSFGFAAALLFFTNIAYVFSNVPADGRWAVQLPITSIFVITYIVLLYFIAKNFNADTRQGMIILLLNFVVASSMYFWGWRIEALFQNVDVLYAIRYIAMAQYIFFYGCGVLAYIAIAKILSTKNA